MAGCCSVGMQLCFNCFTRSCCRGSLICGYVFEDGLVTRLSFLVEGPEMGLS